MRKHFVISGCATDIAPVVAEEPALTVHSSEKDMIAGAEHPLEEAPLAAQPSSVPLVDRMVCVQAHRSSQTAPFIVPDIHRVLEGTGVLECPDHKLDHGVPDPKCDYCKRALGPLYRHSALKESREIPILTFDFSGPHPSTVHPAKQLLVIVWCLREVRLIWAMGVENRDDPHVVAGLQVALDDLTSLTGGCRAPVLRLHSDKAKEFLAASVRKLLRSHGIRQTTNSGYDPAANGIAERWVGIIKVRATALLAEHRLPPDYWTYACKWVAYVHNHRVLNIRLNAGYPLFGDVVVVHRFLKKPPSFEDRGITGVCLGHNPLVSGGVTVGTVSDGLFNVIVTAKVRRLGERRPQRWKLHVHPTEPRAAAYVRNDGEIRWNLNDLDVATVEELEPEGAVEVQNLRSLGMGWAWYVNDLSKYLPDADTLAAMAPTDDDVTGVDHDVPLSEIALEPEKVDLPEEIDPYTAPLPFPHAAPGPAEYESLAGMAPDLLPRSQDVDLVVSAIDIPMPAALRAHLKSWTREDLNVRVFQGVRRGGPPMHRVWCRETFEMDSGKLLAREFFNPDQTSSVRLPTPALPECTPMTADRRSIRSVFWYSETDVLPAHLSRVLPGRALVPAAPSGAPRLPTSDRGEGDVPRMVAERQSPHQRDYIPDSGGVSANGQEPDDEAESGGALGLEHEEVLSQDSFQSAMSQGYRTEEEEGQWDTSVSMVQLGWLNVELKSNDWVKIADQPSVRIMKISMDENKDRKKTKFVNEDDGTGTSVKTYCVADLEMSKQLELAEASYQLRSRILEFNAVSFAAVPLELVPLEVDYVDALSKQDVPDYFAGPSMAKTVTQETRVVFGPEKEEWKAAILAELQSFAKLDVYEAVSRVDVGHQEILPGRLVLVVKPNPEGVKGKKKARIVVCGNFQTIHQDEMTSSKTPSYPMLRMLLSLASYLGWPIETWDVSTAFLYARLYGDRDTDLDGQYIYMRPPKVIEKLGLLPEGTIWKLKKALYGLRTSPLAWEVERDNTLAQLQWEVEERWYGLVPAKGNPCLWAIIELDAENHYVPYVASASAQSQTAKEHGEPSMAKKCRTIGIQTEGQEKPVRLLGGLVTYVDDLLLAMPEWHLRPVVDLLLKKYVMKQSGVLPSGPQKQDVQIGFLGCRITRDQYGTIFCDQEKYIQHCMHENGFVGATQQVTLKPFHRPPDVDERLPEEILSEETKRKHVSECQKYIGQLMWLATRTRPDISAVLGICASMMVKTPQKVARHLVDLWRYVWTTRRFAMSTFTPAMGPSSSSPLPAMGSLDTSSRVTGDQHGSELGENIRQDGCLDGHERISIDRPEFHIHAYTDASFATSGGRSRSGFLVCMVHPETDEYSVLQWSSRRQTITAYSAPEAEIVAMSEGIMTSILTYDAAEFLGVCVGITPFLKIPMKTDSDTGLKQLKNQSIVVRNRPLIKNYSYLRDVCYGTLLHPPCIEPSFLPGKVQKADGMTKILGRNVQMEFMTTLGMSSPSYL